MGRKKIGLIKSLQPVLVELSLFEERSQNGSFVALAACATGEQVSSLHQIKDVAGSNDLPSKLGD